MPREEESNDIMLQSREKIVILRGDRAFWFIFLLNITKRPEKTNRQLMMILQRLECVPECRSLNVGCTCHLQPGLKRGPAVHSRRDRSRVVICRGGGQSSALSAHRHIGQSYAKAMKNPTVVQWRSSSLSAHTQTCRRFFPCLLAHKPLYLLCLCFLNRRILLYILLEMLKELNKVLLCGSHCRQYITNSFQEQVLLAKTLCFCLSTDQLCLKIPPDNPSISLPSITCPGAVFWDSSSYLPKKTHWE